MGAMPKHHILAAQPDQLRDPQPGLHRQKQERPIPAPKPTSLPTSPRPEIRAWRGGLDTGSLSC